MIYINVVVIFLFKKKMQKVILKHLRISRVLYTLPLFVPCNNSKNVYTECLRKTLGIY
jgi:hypothetical protein